MHVGSVSVYLSEEWKEKYVFGVIHILKISFPEEIKNYFAVYK